MNRARIVTLCKVAGVACALMALILVVFLWSGYSESERKPQQLWKPALQLQTRCLGQWHVKCPG